MRLDLWIWRVLLVMIKCCLDVGRLGTLWVRAFYRVISALREGQIGLLRHVDDFDIGDF